MPTIRNSFFCLPEKVKIYSSSQQHGNIKQDLNYIQCTSSNQIRWKLGAINTLKTIKSIGRRQQSPRMNQNSLELKELTYQSLTLPSKRSLSIPQGSSSNAHLNPVILLPVIFFVNQKSRTMAMRISQMMIVLPSSAVIAPLRIHRPNGMALKTTCITNAAPYYVGFISPFSFLSKQQEASTHFQELFIDLLIHSLIIHFLNLYYYNKKCLMKHPVRKAASLILCRGSHKLTSFYDYELLLLQRKSGMQSWASMMVFPGGKQDHYDTQLAMQFGFDKSAIATALRECFEETGLFITQNPLLQTEKIKQINDLRLKFVANQLVSGTDKTLTPYFQQISRVISAQKTLLPFVRLITVPIIKQRFDASFFIHKLQPYKFVNFLKYAEDEKYLHEQNEIVMCGEYSRCQWLSPLEVIRKFMKKQIKLAPPQFIMLNIMSSFHKYDQLIHYLRECSQNQINMGPNVVSMVDNKGYLSQKFPYAATLIGDQAYPFQNSIQYESNDYLIRQLQNYRQKPIIQGKNRFLFQKPAQFFEEEYSFECSVPGSVLNRFQDWHKLLESLQNYQ